MKKREIRDALLGMIAKKEQGYLDEFTLEDLQRNLFILDRCRTDIKDDDDFFDFSIDTSTGEIDISRTTNYYPSWGWEELAIVVALIITIASIGYSAYVHGYCQW